MSHTFKFKPYKLKFTREKKTLDEIHKDTIEKFDENTSVILLKKQKIAFINNKINELNKSNIKDKDLKINLLQQKIKNINNEITDLNALNNELDYFEKTRDILIKYYQHEHKIDNINDDMLTETETQTSTIVDSNNTISNSISEDIINAELESDDVLDRLSKLNEIANKNAKEKKPIKRKKNKETTTQQKSILSYLIDSDISGSNDTIVLTENKNDKGTLKEQYLSLTDNMYLCEKIKLSPIKTCLTCDIETTLIQSEGIYVCQKCGKFEYLIIKSEVPSHKDAISEKPKYPYKTINHLIERLNQFQAKQTTLIPSDIYNLIKFELKKMLINPNEISPHIIKKILKKYRLNSYYEHNFLIFSQITNTPPPSLTRDEEEKIKIMFKQTEQPFKKYKPGDRANFLNYSYTLHKLFMILADLSKNEDVCNRMYNNSKYFSLLKSRDKLRMQDLIWKNICKDLNWPYHPSF